MNKNLFNMRLFFWIILAGATSFLLTAGHHAYAQQSKKVGQLNFQVPEDWPVEKRGGLMVPVPTEEYVSIKFKEIEQEFQSIRTDFFGELSGFEASLKSLEESLLKKIETARSQSGTQAGSSGDLTEILSSLELIKSELARLDRKLTNKVAEMKSDMQAISPQVEFIKKNSDELQTQIYRLDEKIDYLQDGQPSSQ